MAASLEQLIRALQQHPEWRDELRRVLLTEDLLALPAQMRELAGGVGDLRLALRDIVHSFAQQQQTMAQQQQTMAQQQQTMAQQQAALDQLRAGLAEVVVLQRQNSEDIAELSRAVGHLSDRVGTTEGWVLEERYRTRGHAYFQRIARRLHVLTGDELETVLAEAVDGGRLTDDQADEVRLADIVARGRWADGEVWLVVEVSWTVGLDDVERAADRARLLSVSGRRAIGVVAGKRVHHEAEEAIRDLGVWRVVNGRVEPPPAAA